MRVVVAGAAGLIGSHLVDELIRRGDDVVAVDNFLTGQRVNLADHAGGDQFTLVEADISERVEIDGPIDAICHLASPASPADFASLPVEILRVGSLGTFNMLGLAMDKAARLLMASTSEVYGEPLVHPQPESYWGNVNTVGPRSCYDESKRFAEAAVSTYRRSFGVDTTIARIFNTYGPRMRPDDGRVVSNFIVQALTGEPITIYGDGSQTRSFCYVDDEVRGLLALLDSDEPGPVNVGNPHEFTVRELAELVIELTGSDVAIDERPRPQDDPTQRKPDITLAMTKLGWSPEVELRDGLQATISYFRQLLG